VSAPLSVREPDALLAVRRPAAASGTPEEQLAVFRRVRDEIADGVRRFVLEGV
jgi:hypothetical protein